MRQSPQIRSILDRVIEWQLGHPNGTKTECEVWLRGEHAAGTLISEPIAARRSDGNGGSVNKKAKLADS